MNSEEFREHFIDTCGHRKTNASGGFGKICKILETGTFVKKESEPSLIVPASGAWRPTYTGKAKDLIADQHHSLQSTEGETSEKPALPRDAVIRHQNGQNTSKCTKSMKTRS